MKSKVTKSSSKPFVTGGKGHMFGKQSAGSKTPGVSGKSNSGNTGRTPIKGGSGHMFGKRGAQAAKPK